MTGFFVFYPGRKNISNSLYSFIPEMDRRKFIGYSLAGIGMAGISPGFCKGNPYMASGSDKDKFSREAMFYRVIPQGAKCDLCPNKCTVTETRQGDCKTRIFQDGKLVTRSYGNPFYVNTEKPEARSLYHFHPGSDMLSVGTAGCNLQCLYCNVYEVSQKNPGEVPHKELFPAEVIANCKKQKVQTLCFTYTEPVAFYEYMLDTAALAKQQGIRTIFTSNGYIHAEPLRKLLPLMNAAVIDVKAFSETSYMKLTGGTIAPVFETLKMIRASGVWLEISHLLVPGMTDNPALIEKMGKWLMDNGFQDTPFHINRFTPYYRLTTLNATSAESLTRSRDVLLKSGLRYVYASTTDDTGLTTFCPDCRGEVIARKNSHSLALPKKPGVCNKCGHKIAGVW
jgi:pyruvate formate lyase activating enzyme